MKSHLKRLTIPTTWPIAKKGTVYIARPAPSKSLKSSVPLVIVFRDMLKLAKTSKEVKQILLNNYVFVDGVRKTDVRDVVGLLDTIEIKGTAEAYRLIINTFGKLELITIKTEESNVRPSKIVGKTILKKGKIQLNFLNGYNLIVDKDNYKVGDVLILELPEKKIKQHLKLVKGATVYMIGGKYVGEKGKIVELKEEIIVFKIGNKEVETAKKYAIVVGGEKPVFTLA